VGGGWLIFDAPEADLGVHPDKTAKLSLELPTSSFYCDDIAQT